MLNYSVEYINKDVVIDVKSINTSLDKTVKDLLNRKKIMDNFSRMSISLSLGLNVDKIKTNDILVTANTITYRNVSRSTNINAFEEYTVKGGNTLTFSGIKYRKENSDHIFSLGPFKFKVDRFIIEGSAAYFCLRIFLYHHKLGLLLKLKSDYFSIFRNDMENFHQLWVNKEMKCNEPMIMIPISGLKGFIDSYYKGEVDLTKYPGIYQTRSLK